MSRIIPILIISSLFSINSFSQDSIKLTVNDSLKQSLTKEISLNELKELVIEQSKSLQEVRDKLNQEGNSSIDPLIGYILAFLGVSISAFVSFKIGTNQGKSNLKIKKIDILTHDKSKLADLKGTIIGKKIDLPTNQTITHEQMSSSAIDSIVFRIQEVQKVSEFFQEDFISKISNYNNSLQNFMGTAKLGKPIDEEEAKKVLAQMKNIETLITENIDAELKKRQQSIDALL